MKYLLGVRYRVGFWLVARDHTFIRSLELFCQNCLLTEECAWWKNSESAEIGKKKAI